MPFPVDISNVRCLQVPVGTNVSVWVLRFRPHKQKKKDKNAVVMRGFACFTPSIVFLVFFTQGIFQEPALSCLIRLNLICYGKEWWNNIVSWHNA